MTDDLLERVRARARDNSFWRYLGVEVMEAGDGRVRLRVPARDDQAPWLARPNGSSSAQPTGSRRQNVSGSSVLGRITSVSGTAPWPSRSQHWVVWSM